MVPMSPFALTTYKNKYAKQHPNGERKEEWPETARRVATSVMSKYVEPKTVARVARLITERKFMPGGRYLYASGLPYPQVNNCVLFRAADSRDGPCGWADTMSKVTTSLMTGAGIGVNYSALRNEGAFIRGMGGTSTGPLALMQMVNEAGRHIMQGGSRRAAIWAGLHWAHPDVFRFVAMKNWSEEVKGLKARDFNFPAPLDGTNISVGLDDDWLAAMSDPSWTKTYTHWGAPHVVDHSWAKTLYWTVVRQMLETAEPGFSCNFGDRFASDLRNACTEVDSEDDSDVCNLASINFARYDRLTHLEDDLTDMITFLLCGTLYSALPTAEMVRVREKNRRLGLGFMGVHEWLLNRGAPYGPNDELKKWLRVYSMAGDVAKLVARRFGIADPIATRAVAPTGTISIVAETTSGIEPIFATAYLRRYLKGRDWKAQYVIDATAARLIKEQGVDPKLIEDAHELAEADVERRVAFQAWTQEFVDQGISSTINLPRWGSSTNNESTVRAFGNMLFRYLPKIRGITAYPDGCRGGQPLNRVSYFEAVGRVGAELDAPCEESSEAAKPQECKAGTCSS
jgi:ribonucleoside-diphosphate reductase alpha chain